MSRFDVHVQYIPGPENVVADALSRWGYPASKAFADTSIHGGEADEEDMLALEAEERREEKECDAEPKVTGEFEAEVIPREGPTKKVVKRRPHRVRVTLRSGRNLEGGPPKRWGLALQTRRKFWSSRRAQKCHQVAGPLEGTALFRKRQLRHQPLRQTHRDEDSRSRAQEACRKKTGNC